MRLVIDTNVIVAELLRKRGRVLIQSSQLEIYMATKIKDEVQYELQKRFGKIVEQKKITQKVADQQLESSLKLIDTKIIIVPLDFYQFLEIEAKKRIPRDINDWETVALALALPTAIWTEDYDFFGCGCPTWTTETLLLQMD